MFYVRLNREKDFKKTQIKLNYTDLNYFYKPQRLNPPPTGWICVVAQFKRLSGGHLNADFVV